MINEVKITNFRGIKKLTLSNCAAINIIVGTNSSGKTAVLEAIFLALSSNPQKIINLRQWRGYDPELAGEAATVLSGFVSDLFRDMNFSEGPEIRLKGDGAATRSLRIARRTGDVLIPASAHVVADAESSAGYVFDWLSANGSHHSASVKMTGKGVEFENTDEIVPSNYFFPAQSPIPSRQVAEWFSDLRKRRQDKLFVKNFTKVFDWIDELSVEIYGGVPVLHASVRNGALLPLPAVSGAVNRMAAILMSIAQRERAIVLVDEIENGVFFDKHRPLAKVLISLARAQGSQLFLTTHSKEWIEAFIDAADGDVDDISLWRQEKVNGKTQALQFDGQTLKAGIEYGSEVRGGNL